MAHESFFPEERLNHARPNDESCSRDQIDDAVEHVYLDAVVNFGGFSTRSLMRFNFVHSQEGAAGAATEP
jgi:hypothetical protein